MLNDEALTCVLDLAALNESGDDLLGLEIEDYFPVVDIPDSVISQSANWQDPTPGSMSS